MTSERDACLTTLHMQQIKLITLWRQLFILQKEFLSKQNQGKLN